MWVRLRRFYKKKPLVKLGKNQLIITVPLEYRQDFGIDEKTVFEVHDTADGSLFIRPVDTKRG